jgi:hypothetical protein
MRVVVRRIGEIVGGVSSMMAMYRQSLFRAFKC